MKLLRSRRPLLRVQTLEDRAVPATLSQFFPTDHIDLGIGFTGGPTGNWSLHIHDHTAGVEAEPDDAVLYVGNGALTTRPAGSAFDFIGVAAGESYYRLPQSQISNLLFLGLAGDEIAVNSLDTYNASTESNGRVNGESAWARMTLLNVQGPGQFSAWKSETEGPVPYIATNDGITATDSLWVNAGGHTHYNYGFTQQGRYAITVKLSGFLNDGQSATLGALVESEPLTFYVSVGNVGQLQFDASTYQVLEGGTNASINVVRTGGSDGRLTVNYATSNGTAQAGSDYTAASGTLTFNDLETSKTIIIPILNDSIDEPNETVQLTLSNAGPATIEDYVRTIEGSNLLGANSTATLTILNDDAPGDNTPPTISDVADRSTNEGTATPPIAFTIGDSQSAIADLLVTASSSNTTLVPNANVVVGGTGANRTVTITPVGDLTGQTTITLTVQDTGGLTTTDTFVLTVNPVNDAPSADGQTVSTRQDESVDVVLTGSDIEDDPLTFEVVDGPTHGTLSGSGANLTYTPNAGFVGQDSFTFVANDGQLDSPPATVTINVTQARAPIPGADQFVVGKGNVVHGNVLGNDSDPDGDPFEATLETQPANGTVVFDAGAFTYSPNGSFTTTDSFTYRLTDNTGRSATATVTIQAASTQAFEKVFAEGDVDLGIAYEDGSWDLHIHQEDEDAEYEADGALFYVGPDALSTRPASSDFDFLGIASGESYYRLPESLNPAVVFLGFGTEEIADGTFESDSLGLILKAVNGPGHFALWRSGDTGPVVSWATSDGLTMADTLSLLSGAHAHYNLGFTAKGRYEITVQAFGTLTGETEPTFSDDVTYYFSVDHVGQVQFEQTTTSVVEGGSKTITLQRVGGSDGPMTVAYATAINPNTVGLASIKDYVPLAGQLTFADGEMSKTITFVTKKDRLNEPVETVGINLTVPAGSFAVVGPNATTMVSIDKPTALKVARVTISDGVRQRSNIETISIRFNRDTNIAAMIANGSIVNAVQLFNGVNQVTLSLDRFHYNATTNTLTIGLTQGGFDPRTPTILTNGRHELRLNTALLQTFVGGLQLTDADRVVDGTHRIGFHRLFGDLNGDARVNKTDATLLRRNWNVSFWQRRYQSYFDLNGDGTVDQTDLTALNALFGSL